MVPSTWILALALVFVVPFHGSSAVATAAARAPASATLIFTADTEGHIGPCTACPSHPGLGGLARRASLLAELRRANPQLLLLDAGNALLGADSVISEGRALVGAYNSLRYDVVHLTPRDLWLGKRPTLDLLAGATFDVVSANLLDEATGEPLAKPFAIRTVGARRIAVIGVSEPPAGAGILPHVTRAMAGVRVEKPVDALAHWLPQAQSKAAARNAGAAPDDGANAPAVILLYYGSPRGLRAIRERFGQDLTVILVGGARPERLPTEGHPPVVGTDEHGKQVARIVLDLDAGGAEVAQMPVSRDLELDPGMAKLLAEYAEAPVDRATDRPAGEPPVEFAAAPDTESPLADEPAAAPEHDSSPLPARRGAAGDPLAGEFAPADPDSASPPLPDEPAPPIEPSSKDAPPEAEPAEELSPEPESEAPEAVPPDRIPARPAGKEPKGIAGVGLTAEQVNKAIDDGSAFLWNFIDQVDRPAGYEPGEHQEHLLAFLALVHADAHTRFPDFDAALRAYLAKSQPRKLGTYELGIFCMLVESYGDPVFLPKLREAARSLLENQGPEGSWSYGVTLDDKLFHDPAQERALQVAGGVALDESDESRQPWKRLTPWDVGRDGDNSVSQYALLGLHAASRSGIRLSPETWKRSLTSHRERQNEDGGWGYTTGSSYGSMACAGICAVAINQHELGEKAPWKDVAVERGLAWLAANFTVSDNPKHPNSWHYYYLYSVERVGRILDTEFVGAHEWYPLGARYLVDAQKEDGRWESTPDSQEPRLPTSFALLFLTRATPSLDVTLKRGGSGTLKTAVAAQSPRIYIILDCSGSMLEELEGREKFEIAREAVRKLIESLPDGSEVALRVYGHRKRWRDPGANEDTQLLLPLAKLDRKKFAAALQSLSARGKTPLARSLTEATADLSGVKRGEGEDPVTVVLLTDGGEDTRPLQDPLAAANAFAELNSGDAGTVNLHVVGFDVGGREDWTEQLHQIADRAGGRYYPADRGAELLRELRAGVFGIPESFTILDERGKPIARGKFGQAKELPEGKYALRTAYAGRQFEQPFWVNTEAVTSVTFDASKVETDDTATEAADEDPPVARAAEEAEAQEPPAPTAGDDPPANAAGPKFCTECGAKRKAGAKFCAACGHKFLARPPGK